MECPLFQKSITILGNSLGGGVHICKNADNGGMMNENEITIAELVHARLPDLVLFAKQWKHGCAEDIVQEAFLKLLRQKVLPDNPVAWLYTVVRNLSNNELRARHRRKRREYDVQVSKGLFDVPDTDQKEEIDQLIQQLDALDLEYRVVSSAMVNRSVRVDMAIAFDRLLLTFPAAINVPGSNVPIRPCTCCENMLYCVL